jgi:hypothetical protein
MVHENTTGLSVAKIFLVGLSVANIFGRFSVTPQTPLVPYDDLLLKKDPFGRRPTIGRRFQRRVKAKRKMRVM